MRFWLLMLLSVSLMGCSSMMTKAGRGVASDLRAALQNSDDPELVREALPAYLLMLDALLQRHADQPDLLLAAAQLNAAYACAFVPPGARQLQITDKALTEAGQALCLQRAGWCAIRHEALPQLTQQLAGIDRAALPALFTLATVWAGWIQARSNDWNAIADLARVQMLLQAVDRQDPTFEQGSVHLYLGALDTLLPPALGGRQKEGVAELERAIALSQGHDLMAKVIWAQQVARVNYDRPTHDRLLHEVLAADPHAPGWTLKNCLAQEKARALLKSADDYF